ncbi:MAG: hypothetical protein AAGC85_19915 [Bacteroidota bacterium]
MYQEVGRYGNAKEGVNGFLGSQKNNVAVFTTGLLPYSRLEVLFQNSLIQSSLIQHSSILSFKT